MRVNRVLRWLRRAAWLVCWVPGVALANDSESGGAGADLVPLPAPEPPVSAAPAAPGPATVTPGGTREPNAATTERQSRAEPVAPPAVSPAPALSSAGCRIVPGADTVPERGATMLAACAAVSFVRAALLRPRQRCPRKTP